MANYIQDIRDNLIKQRYSNEIEYITKELIKNKSTEEIHNLSKRSDQVKVIIETLDKELEIKRNKKNNKFDSINELVYNKLWTKLQDFQKEDRLTKYITDCCNAKNICKTDQDILIKKAVELFSSKSNSKQVVYDPEKATIISILCFKYYEKNKKFNFVNKKDI